jgi:hypothetical protein
MDAVQRELLMLRLGKPLPPLYFSVLLSRAGRVHQHFTRLAVQKQREQAAAPATNQKRPPSSGRARKRQQARKQNSLQGRQPNHNAPSRGRLVFDFTPSLLSHAF